jgi:hypothetical protein
MATKKTAPKTVETKADASGPEKKGFKWGWNETIIAISAVALLSMGGIVYYGTVEQPKIDKAANVSACETFNEGLAKAEALMAPESAKTDPAVKADALFNNLFAYNDKAYEKVQNKDLEAAFGDLAFAAMSVNADQDWVIIQATLTDKIVEIQNQCGVILDATVE